MSLSIVPLQKGDIYDKVNIAVLNCMDTQKQQNTKKILVVEDEKYLRELYVEILQEQGYEIHQATDGQEAYTAMLNGGYDLVLLDIMLPKMDGLKILEKLKNETPPQKPNNVIVILSNLGQDSVIAQCLALGARGTMIKSDYTPNQIVETIKRYLSSG